MMGNASSRPASSFLAALCRSIAELRLSTPSGNVKSANPGLPDFELGSVERIDRLGPYLPWEWTDDDGITILRGKTPGSPEGIGFTIELYPQTGFTAEMEKAMIELAGPLFPGCTLAVTAYASPAVEGMTEAMETATAAAPGLSESAARILRRSSAARRRTLNRGARRQMVPQAPVVVRHWRVWLSVVMPLSDPERPAVREAVLTARRAMTAVLEQSGLFLANWDRETLVGTVAELLNLPAVRAEDFIRPAANPFEPPALQVMLPDTELTVEKHRLRFQCAEDSENDTVYTGLTITRYPDRVSMADAAAMLGDLGRGGAQIPSPFLFTSLCRLLDSADERVKLETMRVRAKQMSQTPISLYSSHYHDRAKELTIAVKSFETEGGTAQVMHILGILAGRDDEAEAVNAAQAIARKLGAELRRGTSLHAPLLLAQLPMAAGPLLCDDLRSAGFLERRTLATALYFAPVVTEWQGTPPRDDERRKTPLLTLLGRRGQIMHVDFFANANGNYSATIVGKPGSGKSVVMNMLAVSVLSQGGFVWVIDVGRSYEKTAHLFDGDFLEFDSEHVWNLNPFLILDLLSSEDRDEGIESVVSILGELLSPGAPLPDLQRSVLISIVSDAAISAAREGRTADMADIDRGLALFAAKDRRLDDLRLQLAPYLTGPLAKWFDGSGSPVRFDKRLTVLELEGLSAHPALRQAVLLTLMTFIERRMAEDRTLVKLVLIDEAWDLMGSGHSGRFIEMGFRRARKHKGSFVVATQSIADFFHSDTAKAAWDCADTRIFLRQDPEVVTALEASGALAPDPWFKSALSSLTTVRGAWSEMIVKVGDSPYAIGRLVLDRFTQVLFSSLPAEFAAVAAWRAAGADMASAVAAVAEGRMTPDPESIRRINRAAEAADD